MKPTLTASSNTPRLRLMASKSAENEAQAFYERQRKSLGADQLVTEKKMFGTTALCTRGKVFMFPWKKNLVFKLPEDRVSALVAAKSGELFDPGHGRTSKTWVAVFAKAKREWPALAKAAREFVET